jgi:Papain-like cysteine protease AvrRpt2
MQCESPAMSASSGEGAAVASAVRPATLDRTRIVLELPELGPRIDSKLGERLLDVFGSVTLPVSRRFRLWDWLRWLLPRWDRLSFQMQPQQQTNWCWAAVSTSVALYYDAASTWTQCSVANGELSRSDCCGSGAATACNVYGYLASALQRVGHLDHWDGNAAVFQTVDDEVDAGRPIGIRVAWSGGGAHFLAIIGYLEDTQNYVAVDDPIYGKSDVTYDTLKTSYQGSGTWTHTYYTKA